MRRLLPFQHHAIRITTVALLALLSGCGSCGGKSSRTPPGQAGIDTAAGSSTATNTATGAQSTATSTNPSASNAGVTVPPITANNVTVLDTSGGPAVDHLTFASSSATEAGRYLSEFLVTIHAKQTSCVRLKVRPTGGLTTSANDTSAANGIQGDGPCASNPAIGEAKAGTSTATMSGTATGTASLVDSPDAYWQPITEAPTMALAGQTPAVCAPRLFRMQSSQSSTSQGLENVVSKTGRLLIIGKSVRIWLDEEFSNVCSAGSPLDNRQPTSFAPLRQMNSPYVSAGWGDKLWTAQLQNLADEMDKITANMTATFGPLSDVDSSGFVEIFLSPEVNRQYLRPYKTQKVDDFVADYIYRPQDLAFYNAQTNPLSNEGEVLYLWTPDPGGIYNYRNFPSSNSISSNYAKGYLASQLMTQLIANQRLLVQKQATIPDRWLIEGLAGLASAYYAGNDFSAYYLEHYLSSRPQYIPLDGEIDTNLVDSLYMPMAKSEQFGLRTIFAWYLHSRLCGGDNVAPCAKLASLIKSKKSGIDAVTEALGGETPATFMPHFGLSVGVSLVEKPDAVRAIWAQNPPPPGLPTAPVKMPDLTAIFQSDPRVTSEEDNGGTTVLTADPTDMTFAGPFPSKQMMLFQPMTADSDLQFKVAPNTVSYVLVTALVEANTEVTATLGQGLNITFTPLGERDGAVRRIHVKKVSQNALSDLRPDNLTATSDVNTTYSNPQFYANIDYTVTPARQVWVLGSIDNYSLNVEGTDTVVGGNGAFDVQINPCAGVADQDACSKKAHHVFVQASIRDFDKQVAPMLVVTSPDRALFRGHAIPGHIADIDTGFKGDKDTDLYVQCEAGSAISGLSVSFDATGTGTTGAAHGLVNYTQLTASVVHFTPPPSPKTMTSFPATLLPFHDYKVKVISGTSFQVVDTSGNVVAVGAGSATLRPNTIGLCANGGKNSQFVFDHNLTKAVSGTYLHTYDNFLQMGLMGFPYTTIGSVNYDGIKSCPGFRCYYKEENFREHFLFALTNDVKPKTYHYQPTYGINVVKDTTQNALSSSTVTTLAMIKNMIDSPTCADPQSQDFISQCASVANLTTTQCTSVCGAGNAANTTSIEASVAGYLAQNNSFLLCQAGVDCTPHQTLLVPGKFTNSWVDTAKYVAYSAEQKKMSTYYKPIEPSPGLSDYCMGDIDANTNSTALRRCTVRARSINETKDFRQQLNLDSSLLSMGSCADSVLDQDFKACIDNISVNRELTPDETPFPTKIGYAIAGERQRLRSTAIAARAGEIVAKVERLHAVIFEVPSTGAVANILVGGRKLTQGKYMLRIYVAD